MVVYQNPRATTYGGKVEFTPKYIIVWVQAHATFHNPKTTPSGRKVEFAPKYIIVGVKEGYQKFVRGAILLFLVIEGRMQNFRFLGQPILGEK